MKTLGSAILVLALVLTFSSVCMAQDLSKAYSLYYQGKMKEAIGAFYKKRLITIERNGIRLIEK